MRKFLFLLITILLIPFFTNAQTISIQDLSPGTTVIAKNKLSFSIQVSGFIPQFYQLTDSFSGSTVSVNDIDGGGHFIWTPIASDAGTHVFSIAATDYSGDMASTSATVTVAPPPSLTVQNLTPTGPIMPGTKLTFTVIPTGFTNPSYIVGDSFSGSAVGDNSIDASGNFSWTPGQSENGDHVINVYASDSLGHNASVNVPVRVGSGPSLLISPPSPATTISPGTTVSFTVSGLNFSPTSFGISDNFSGTTLASTNVNTSGTFQWTPSASDAGVHVLTVTGIVGAFGDKASATVTINVEGPDGKVPNTGTSDTSSGTVATTNASSTNSSSNSLGDLQAKLAQLTAQIAAQTSGSTPTNVAFKTYLYQGMSGDEITHLQTVLAQQGFFTADINGTFGPLTVAAVKKFQIAHGLEPLGVVGPSTRVALNALHIDTSNASNTMSSGSDGYVFKNFIAWGQKGTEVLELQKRLIALGFLASGSASGYFGNGTYEALIAFQKAHGLDQKGYVGPGTRAALNH